MKKIKTDIQNVSALLEQYMSLDGQLNDSDCAAIKQSELFMRQITIQLRRTQFKEILISSAKRFGLLPLALTLKKKLVKP